MNGAGGGGHLHGRLRHIQPHEGAPFLCGNPKPEVEGPEVAEGEALLHVAEQDAVLLGHLVHVRVGRVLPVFALEVVKYPHVRCPRLAGARTGRAAAVDWAGAKIPRN